MVKYSVTATLSPVMSSRQVRFFISDLKDLYPGLLAEAGHPEAVSLIDKLVIERIPADGRK